MLPQTLQAPITPEETATLRIVARDPSVKVGGRILTALVPVPAEHLAPGPWGHRVQVLDYDASTRTYCAPLAYATESRGLPRDPFERASDAVLLADPRFHQQNAYAIVMRTLATFERVLGRRIGWGFGAHQIKVVPHAFQDANAFYSERDYGLYFGYFEGDRAPVFTCLSHHVVAHETAHALLDGLRTRFTDPSSPDQAAFHEGFADVVAILSVFQLRAIVERMLAGAAGRPGRALKPGFLSEPAVLHELFGMAAEMGAALHYPGGVLRESYHLKPDRTAYAGPGFVEPHRRGELLVAAMLHAFVRVWKARLGRPRGGGGGAYDRDLAVEEGANAAEHLLGIAIRGIDYTPPVHLTFGDFLSALLTADAEIQPDDTRFAYRRKLRESFAEWGILPSARRKESRHAERAPREPGLWCPVEGRDLSYHGVHQEAMRRDPDEVFRFLWENRDALHLREEAYSEVISVRPCRRVAPDGAPFQETVVEFSQQWDLTAQECRRHGLPAPESKGDDAAERTTALMGGATLLFDDFGRLKYFVHNSVGNLARQRRRLEYQRDALRGGFPATRRFDELHRRRVMNARLSAPDERW